MQHGRTSFNRHHCRCDVCIAGDRQYRQDHAEEVRAASRRYRAANAEKIRLRQSALRAERRDQINAGASAYRSANPEKVKAAQSRYRSANPARVSATKQRHRVANLAKIKTYEKAYRLAHPEQNRDGRRRRRARLRGVGVLLVTQREWLRLCARFDHRCAYCRELRTLTRDHVIPITRGGRHAIGNLLPACQPCNASKGTKLLVEWRGRP